MEDHSCPKTRQTLRDGQLLVGCADCLPSTVSQGDTAGHFRRYQQAHYRRELTQPNEGRKFIQAYGVEHARSVGYSDDDLRKLA